MSKEFLNGLFRFRQDLRVEDNHGLFEAIERSKYILPIFIFDTTILKSSPKNDKRVGFLVEAVTQLHKALQARGSHLHVYYGDPQKIIPKLLHNHKIDALFANKSYGLGSLSRDRDISHWCSSHGVVAHWVNDFLLVEPEVIPARKVFTPYSKRRYRYLEENPPRTVTLPKKISTLQIPIEHAYEKIITELSAGENTSRPVDGREQRIKNFSGENYDQTRNSLSLDGTSKISPYIRFGLVSIREIYTTFRAHTTFINELARREFRQHIYHYHPETRLREFQEKRRHIAWSHDKKLFSKWTQGETGYPIVDAAMKQLLQENRMHGRARMIVASFLTKDLLIDWRLGEQRFARHLLDYDANVNMGNRQWSASVGADPKPLRIFNPILQSKRFDPQASYILRYLPELEGQQLNAIHDPLSSHLDYHKPIVDHYLASKQAKQAYYRQA